MRWLQSEAAVLWAGVSWLAELAASRCVRKNCRACRSGEQHQSYVLYNRVEGRRIAVYVPEELVPDVQRSLDNGRALQNLPHQAARSTRSSPRGSGVANGPRATPYAFVLIWSLFSETSPSTRSPPAKCRNIRVHRMTSFQETNPLSKSKHKPRTKPPARSTLHDEIVTLRMVLKTAVRHGWLQHLPDLSPPYKTQGKVVHRPWFSPEEYKQLYEAARAYANKPSNGRFKWNAEQVYDFILFMANTGLRPDEAFNLQHGDVAIVTDDASGNQILEIEVRGKRGVGHCKSTPGAVRTYQRLLARPKPVQGETHRQRQQRRKEGGEPPPPPAVEYPKLTDLLFPGNHIKLFNNLLDRIGLKLDRDEKPRTAYSLRHTYICMRLMEGADIYQIAKNCRTSVEMIEKHYAIHLKNTGLLPIEWVIFLEFECDSGI